MADSKPHVLMLWHSLTGYSAAGMRALAERAEVTVLARPLTRSHRMSTPNWTSVVPTWSCRRLPMAFRAARRNDCANPT